MIGAIIGDIVGSRFEWNNCKSKDFELLTDETHYTDDTVMTLAIAEALLLSKAKNYTNLADCAIVSMRDWGNKYPEAGYGGMFTAWLHSEFPAPYNSFGNGLL